LTASTRPFFDQSSSPSLGAEIGVFVNAAPTDPAGSDALVANPNHTTTAFGSGEASGARVFVPATPSAKAAGNGKVDVCHFPPGNPDNVQQISVSSKALSAHLGHGDVATVHADEEICGDGFDNNCNGEVDEGCSVRITADGEAYGHHGACSGWNGCGDAATCAQWACEINGYTTAVSFGDDRPCTQFDNCHLFYNQSNIQWNWGNWCNVQGVTDIDCS
jgi:hypothetical protein